MMTLLFLISVGLFVWLVLRSARLHRERWIESLSLPGQWRCISGAQEHLLEFNAEIGTEGLLAGSWSLRGQEGKVDAVGHWHITGRVLTLKSDVGPTPESGGASSTATVHESMQLALLRFEDGSIGLNGDVWGPRVYERIVPSNVVPLRSRQR